MTSWSYDQLAIVATVHCERPHQKTAYQVFHQQGPLAFLPLTAPHQCSIVWSTEVEQAHALMHANEQLFNNELTQAFAHHLGK